ncbi:hypothetical protein H5410_027418 [Solanum commersonii]|uniref:Uncharacterized protein n=1 Tax=Solanum commersonii TaxID=4109 RepID=A0A9J5Z4E1_SOLCO|nr:hypothetical protein H5410_027418 [Solanum commersonii]
MEVEEEQKEKDLNLDEPVQIEPDSLVTCLRAIRAHQPPRNSATPQRITPTEVNPIGALPHFSYHYVSTLPDRWQVVSPSVLLDLPIDPTISSTNELVIDQDHPYIALRQQEQIGVHKENIFRDLPDLAGTVVQTLLAETSMAVSSEAGSSEVTPDTETLVQTDTPGIDA